MQKTYEATTFCKCEKHTLPVPSTGYRGKKCPSYQDTVVLWDVEFSSALQDAQISRALSELDKLTHNKEEEEEEVSFSLQGCSLDVSEMDHVQIMCSVHKVIAVGHFSLSYLKDNRMASSMR